MIFSVLILALIGVVAFFHYTQGFFSATISAVLVVLSAVLAVGYHEVLVATMLKGALADQAHAICLIVLFAAGYFVLRLAFDSIIPGNVRLPLIVDKVGAGAMGLVAGLFAGGVVALAAQMLPFGPSIGGYTRWELNDAREVRVPDPGGRTMDAEVNGDLKADRIDYAHQSGMIIPADNLLVNTVAKLSDNGSLAGAQPLRAVHPDLLGELAAARHGIQIGAKHTAYDTNKGQAMTVAGVFTAPQFAQWDAELPDVRGTRETAVAPVLKPDASQVILVIPAQFSNNVTDSDGKVRFSMGAVRLKAGAEGDEKNFHPVGTLAAGPVLFNNKDDDFVVAEAGKNVYFVFVAPAEDVLANYDPKTKDWKVIPGAFLEFKRFARKDLGGEDVNFKTPAATDSGVLRKQQVVKAATEKLPAGIPAAAPMTPAPAGQQSTQQQQSPAAAPSQGAGGGKSGGNVPGVENTAEGIRGGF